RTVFTSARQSTTELQYQSIRGVRTYQARLVPQLNEHGVENVVVILRDITELKYTAEKLRESEQRFRSIIRNTPDAFYLLRAVRDAKTRAIIDFVIDEMNDRGATMLGVSPETV